MRWRDTVSRVAVCLKALVCDEAWEALSETARCTVRPEWTGLVWGLGEAHAGYEDRDRQGLRSPHPRLLQAVHCRSRRNRTGTFVLITLQWF